MQVEADAATCIVCRLCAKEILAADAHRPTIDRAGSRRGKERHGFGDVLWLATLRQRAEATADFAWADRHRRGHCRFDEAQIGRASCRERVCQYVLISVVAGSLKKKNT